MTNAFKQLIRESDKATSVPESIAKYAAALVAGTHEITSMTIRPKRQWVGLEREIAAAVLDHCYGHGGVSDDMIERTTEVIKAKLKEKNT